MRKRRGKTKRKVRKNPATKKRITKKKVRVSAKSRTTGEKPTKRLKKRRLANIKKGYYPNPVKKNYVIAAVKNGKLGFYTGDSLHNKAQALKFGKKSVADKQIKLLKSRVDRIGVFKATDSESTIKNAFL